MARGINERNPDVSPAEIQKYLKGVDYPATKRDLVECVMENGAPEEVVRIVEMFDERQYSGPQEVTRAYGQSREAVGGEEERGMY